jgi:hypothetical protein
MYKLEGIEQQLSSTQNQMDVISAEVFRIGSLVPAYSTADCSLLNSSDAKRRAQSRNVTNRLDKQEGKKASAIIETRAASQCLQFQQSLKSLKKIPDSSNALQTETDGSSSYQFLPRYESKPKSSCVAKKPSIRGIMTALFGIRPAAPRLAVTGSRMIHPNSPFNLFVSGIMLVLLTYSALVIPMELAYNPNDPCRNLPTFWHTHC